MIMTSEPASEQRVGILPQRFTTRKRCRSPAQVLQCTRTMVTAKLVLNGIECVGVIDTGASLSFISAELVKRFSEPVKEIADVQIRTADGRRLHATESYLVDAEFDGYTTRFPFLVMPNLIDNVLLGLDFLRSAKATLCFLGRSVRLDTPRDSDLSEEEEKDDTSAVKVEAKEDDTSAVMEEAKHDDIVAVKVEATETVEDLGSENSDVQMNIAIKSELSVEDDDTSTTVKEEATATVKVEDLWRIVERFSNEPIILPAEVERRLDMYIDEGHSKKKRYRIRYDGCRYQTRLFPERRLIVVEIKPDIPNTNQETNA